ncbi:TIGR00725 family protein [bacterium]|nr:TIGR00725 family protein [bacterium]
MIIGVIGGASCSMGVNRTSYEVGKKIAERGDFLVCGGMGGVMEGACKGCREAGGITIGILPGKNKEKHVNPYITVPVITAMDHARNAIIVRTADLLIAIDGAYGTLSEIGLALACKKKVFGLNSWNIKGVIPIKTVDELFEKINNLDEIYEPIKI